MVDVLEAVLRAWTEPAGNTVGLRPDVGFNPPPTHVLQSQDQLVDVRVALAFQGTTVGDPVLDVQHKGPGVGCGVVHLPGVREEPLDVAVRVDAAVRPSVSVGGGW